jgi:hypothetical protein
MAQTFLCVNSFLPVKASIGDIRLVHTNRKFNQKTQFCSPWSILNQYLTVYSQDFDTMLTNYSEEESGCLLHFIFKEWGIISRIIYTTKIGIAGNVISHTLETTVIQSLLFGS